MAEFIPARWQINVICVTNFNVHLVNEVYRLGLESLRYYLFGRHNAPHQSFLNYVNGEFPIPSSCSFISDAVTQDLNFID